MNRSDEPHYQEEVYHGFYQWVGIALFGQSFTFYIPHFLWKSCEGRKVERLVSGRPLVQGSGFNEKYCRNYLSSSH